MLHAIKVAPLKFMLPRLVQLNFAVATESVVIDKFFNARYSSGGSSARSMQSCHQTDRW